MIRTRAAQLTPIVPLSSLLLLACGGAVSAGAPEDDPPRATLEVVEQVAGGGGTNLAVYEAGQHGRPAIVLLHGFSQNTLSWERLFAGPLAEEFHLVSYDLRGHGASDKPLDPDAYSNSQLWAEDLAAVIRARNLDRPVLIGWSYGGYIIADYVRQYGDANLGGLVFLGAVTKNGTEEAAAHMSDEALALFGDVLSPNVQTSMNATRAFMRLFTDEAGHDAFEIAFGSAMMVPQEARLGMFSRELDNDDVLSGIRVPSLVIHGGTDRIVKLSAGEHIARTVPGARLVPFEGVGHAPHLDAPERFERDVAEFVRGSRGGR